MIPPHQRTSVYSYWKEIARSEYKLDIRDDRPFSVYKGGKELRVNTKHSVIIALRDRQIYVWNKPLQYAGTPITIFELERYHVILTEVWNSIEGDVE